MMFVAMNVMNTDYFYSAFSSEDSGNASRIDTYSFLFDNIFLAGVSGVNEAVRLLFGEAGYIRGLMENSAENFFLMVMGDIGLIGLIGYLYFMQRLTSAPRGLNITLEKLLLAGFLFVTPAGEKLYLNVMIWIVILGWKRSWEDSAPSDLPLATTHPPQAPRSVAGADLHLGATFARPIVRNLG